MPCSNGYEQTLVEKGSFDIYSRCLKERSDFLVGQVEDQHGITLFVAQFCYF